MKTPEKLFHMMLGLGNEWQIAELKFNPDTGEVSLRIEATAGLLQKELCSADNGRLSPYGSGRDREWRHLNVFEHKCYIRCKLPRAKCEDCGKVHQIKAPWEGLSIHFTSAFESMALILMKEMPIKSAARIVGETDTRLWRMLARHVKAAYKTLDFSEVTHIGMDETSSKKGQRYVTIFADILKRRVLFVAPNRDSATWGAFIEELNKHGGRSESIRCISMDMSAIYRAGAKRYCPDAQIVFDKYHLIAMANEAVNRVRRAEVRRGFRHNDLKLSRWLWLKNPENLSERQVEHLNRIDKENLATATAYQMRLALQDIYRLPSLEQARQRLTAWCRWVHRKAKRTKYELLANMVRVAKSIENHMSGILEHWKEGITNAYMEGINSMFQMVKRRARGYRSDENFIMMIYFIGSGLELPVQPAIYNAK